ncbi:multicopper oxidase family protein [Paenibacillus sp. 1011MAR3C5]|uniref:multicopper oxidase family protein n=1 Tax=Paenibacillus sp. 1011MAR3C5 TaxID=1675787 RepID=UPI000E6C4406|nr:multicopper oxidase family protein [Paenibacillus sp. 1011MAR3C5]RJE86063.1 multicopper oxidase family protein [Paenibacillus sp. 1011MAR3C5]
MYSALTNISLGSLFLLLIISLIAANKVSKLIFSRTEMELHRRARKLRFWTVMPSVLAAGSISADVMLASISPPVFWMDRLFLRMPLALLALSLLWLLAWPRLQMLIQRTQSQREITPDMPRRRHATDTALVAPYKWLALVSAFLVYFILSPPVPFLMVEIAIPLTAMLFLGSLLWMHQSSRNAAASASDAVTVYRPWSRRARITGLAAVACAVLSVPLLIAMDASRQPGSLSMMAGKPDYGMIREASGKLVKSDSPVSHAHHSLPVATAVLTPDETGIPVTALSGPQEGKPDQSFTLTARKASMALSSGKVIEAWTYNGELPGPEIRVREGELVEVTLYNEDIEAGATLHWHGLDVPNAEDGVAGATQDAVMPGGSHTYRFVAEQAGTFWYHSHQHSKEAVEKGLFGALIVEPVETDHQPDHDIVVLTHIWDGAGTAVGNSDTLQRIQIQPGERVKFRLIQTDNWLRRSYTLSGTSFMVTAIDGVDLNGPEPLQNTELVLTTGGRYDVEFTMPEESVYLSIDGMRDRGLLMSADGTGEVPQTSRPSTVFDPTHYGEEASTPFDANSDFDRAFTMILDNRLAFLGGVPALYDTINGKVFPDTPMYMVKEGELVKTTIYNRSAVDHPMHLHGHHMLVLSRNGELVTGSPWWSDTLDVAPGEVYEVAFLANNPGLWMDHCHNLQHAAAGMTMHLMYEGVTSPFQIGVDTHNHPE